MIVLFAGEKGGAGKSTLAVLTAIERARAGRRVVLVDADTQATATKWLARRQREKITPQVPTMQLFERGRGVADDLESAMATLVKDFEDIVIDTGGRDSAEMRRALAFAQVAVFPLRPTMNDLDTAHPMDAVTGRIMAKANPNLRTFFTVTQAPSNPFRGSVTGDAKDFLSDCGNIVTGATVIYSRAAYERATIEGRSVSELDPPDNKAAREIADFLTEVFHDQ